MEKAAAIVNACVQLISHKHNYSAGLKAGERESRESPVLMSVPPLIQSVPVLPFAIADKRCAAALTLIRLILWKTRFYMWIENHVRVCDVKDLNGLKECAEKQKANSTQSLLLLRAELYFCYTNLFLRWFLDETVNFFVRFSGQRVKIDFAQKSHF